MPRSRWSRASAVAVLRRLQGLEVDPSDEASERGGAALREPAAASAPPATAAPAPPGSAGSRRTPGSPTRSISRARRDWISCPQIARSAAWATVARSGRAQTAERADRRAEQWIAREAPVELARVVVEREQEARFVDRALAGRANETAPVVELARLGPAPLRQLRLPGLGPGRELQGVETLARKIASTISPA